MSRGRDRSCRKVPIATWALGAALLCVAATAPDLSAQDAGATQKDPASEQFAAADSIRAGFDRPPAQPATDWVDVVEFPLKVIAFPFNLLFVKFPGWVAGQLMVEREPSGIVRAYRSMENWGFRPMLRTSIGPRSSLAIEGHRYVVRQHLGPRCLKLGHSPDEHTIPSVPPKLRTGRALYEEHETPIGVDKHARRR